MTKLAGSLNLYNFAQADNVWSLDGISPTIITGASQIGHQINVLPQEDENIAEENMGKLKIRKLTEGECMRLMGFEKEDTEACREAGLSKTNIYHQSGDSIVTTVLMGVFGELFDPTYRNKIEDYCEKLAKEKTP